VLLNTEMFNFKEFQRISIRDTGQMRKNVYLTSICVSV